MLMQKVYWVLGGETFSSYNDFVQAVTRYNQQIAPDRSEWQPDRVVCQGPARIVYEALWKDEDDLLQVVVSTLAEPITMGQILFALHNQSAAFFQDTDQRFFEGLEAGQDGVLWLQVGS